MNLRSSGTIGDGEISRNYDIEGQTLIDFALTNALEFLSENLDSWPDQILGLGENLEQNSGSTSVNQLSDAGRKRTRSIRSPRGSIYQIEEVRSRRYSEQMAYIPMNAIPSSIQPNVGQLIPGVIVDPMFQGAPRSASNLFAMPPTVSPYMPQYCMPTNFNEYHHQDQQNHPHRRPSAEIAAAILKAKGAPDDLSTIDPNGDIFQQIHDGQGSLPINPQLDGGNPSHGNTKLCKYRGCKNTTVQRSPYCASHAGSRKCQQEGCTKCAQGSTKLCIAHGGGRRCTFPGCTKGARDKFFCAGHGGGKRCETEGCTKSAVGSSKFCTNHGGGKRCKEPGCQKSAQSSTPYCVRHGGGRKCCVAGCSKSARGKTTFCAAHTLPELKYHTANSFSSDNSDATNTSKSEPSESSSRSSSNDSSSNNSDGSSNNIDNNQCEYNELIHMMNFTKLKIKLKP